MKICLMILVLFIFGFMAQAQVLPEGWQDKSDTVFKQGTWVISIAKVRATGYVESRNRAMDTARAKANKFLKSKLKNDTLQFPIYELIDDEVRYDTDSNCFVYRVAIRAKNCLFDMKKKPPKD